MARLPEYQPEFISNSYNNNAVERNIWRALASDGAADHHEFLLSNNTTEGQVPLSALDDEKQTTMICFFFSANWCRPCKAFTTHLVQLYNDLRNSAANNKQLEIIFVSLDEDEVGFDQHFKSMPWLAIPFENNNIRKQLRARYNVNRIPSLVPLCNVDGGELDQDIVGLIEDYGTDAFPFTRKRREELKAMDDARRHNGKLLEDLSRHGGLDYLVSQDCRKLPVSTLAGKTIGFYFGANWCPPSRAFTKKLVSVYNELIITQSASFQVFFVSTDRNQEEFDSSMSTMPWLAIPYHHNKPRHDLCRIFEIKGIPSLVIIGPDGKTVSRNGKDMISSYGAEAFPFTDSRITEVEADIRKQGEGMSMEAKDLKHDHILKLDMAKAYICNFCKEEGRFWVYSCSQCDFDLHPKCLEEI